MSDDNFLEFVYTNFRNKLSKDTHAWGDVVACSITGHRKQGGLYKDESILNFPTPIFMIQIALCALVTGICNFALRRFGISSYFSHTLAAILLNRSGFLLKFLCSEQSIHLLETFQEIGSLLFLFLIGLKVDMQMAKGSGRKALFIGFTVAILPILITVPTAYNLGINTHTYDAFKITYDSDATKAFVAVAWVESQTSFHVVTCFLTDLEILNTEIGRLAIASSMISNIFSWSALMTALVVFDISGGYDFNPFKAFMSHTLAFLLVLLIIYGFRPIMVGMIKSISQGTNHPKEIHVVIVFMMIFVSSFLAQFISQPPGFGPLVLGLVVPHGPPLAETIEDQLETIVLYVFLPLFYFASVSKSGGVANYEDTIEYTALKFVMFITFLAFITKGIGAIIPSMFCGESLKDSLVLALILASQGLMDLVYFTLALGNKHISVNLYTVMMYASTAIAGITSVSVKVLYKSKSSMDHLGYKKMTIGDSMHDANFKILACVYEDYNVPNIIKLIEASNPTDKSPIHLYLLHLIELRRIAPPFLISHKKNEDSSIHYIRSKHIINAFRFFQRKYNNRISLDLFSALSPSSTMHHDICSLAANKSAALIILPFHRQFNLEKIMEANTTIRNVNSNVLKSSPCSVGLLVDQRRVTTSSSINESKSSLHIALIFLGGADDREVLTYGMRMVDNPSVTITVIRFRLEEDMHINLTEDKRLDMELLHDFKRNFIGIEGVSYIEETVSDGFGIMGLMREFADKFDLIIVGRQHGKKRKTFSGFSEWVEYPELGFMGDMLASSKLLEGSSILVLQQNFQISLDLTLGSNYKINI